MRWQHPELDPIIEAIQRLDFDDPQGIELGIEFIKLAAREMPITPIMSYNVFSVCDETYWKASRQRMIPIPTPLPTGRTPSICLSRSNPWLRLSFNTPPGYFSGGVSLVWRMSRAQVFSRLPPSPHWPVHHGDFPGGHIDLSHSSPFAQ